MRTQLNGKDADWPDWVREKWDAFLTSAIPALDATTVTSSNYFQPRPAVDEYNRGSREEGFTFVVSTGRYTGPSVRQTIIKRHRAIGGDPDLRRL